jgi:hypothetical protein
MAQAFRLWALISKVRSMMNEMAPEQVSVRVPSVFTTNHHSAVASYASITAPGVYVSPGWLRSYCHHCNADVVIIIIIIIIIII